MCVFDGIINGSHHQRRCEWGRFKSFAVGFPPFLFMMLFSLYCLVVWFVAWHGFVFVFVFCGMARYALPCHEMGWIAVRGVGSFCRKRMHAQHHNGNIVLRGRVCVEIFAVKIQSCLTPLPEMGRGTWLYVSLFFAPTLRLLLVIECRWLHACA